MNVLDEILQELREVRRENAELRALFAGIAPQESTAQHLDTKEAAALLKLSVHTVRKNCRDGKLPHHSAGPGAKLYFLRSELVAHMERTTPTTTEAAMHVMHRSRSRRRAV
jgi:excisionase family DNA binding protein